MPMQPRPSAETSRSLLPSLRCCMLVLPCGAMNRLVYFARQDLDGRGACACADHRAEVGAAVVLRPVGVVDEVVDRALDLLERDFLRPAGGGDPPRLLAYRGLMPARGPPVVGAHIEAVADRDGPDPRRGAVRHPVL